MAEQIDKKEITRLIQYHTDGLSQYRFTMSPAAQYLEERTIKALEELGQFEEKACAYCQEHGWKEPD